MVVLTEPMPLAYYSCRHEGEHVNCLHCMIRKGDLDEISRVLNMYVDEQVSLEHEYGSMAEIAGASGQVHVVRAFCKVFDSGVIAKYALVGALRNGTDEAVAECKKIYTEINSFAPIGVLGLLLACKDANAIRRLVSLDWPPSIKNALFANITQEVNNRRAELLFIGNLEKLSCEYEAERI